MAVNAGTLTLVNKTPYEIIVKDITRACSYKEILDTTNPDEFNPFRAGSKQNPAKQTISWTSPWCAIGNVIRGDVKKENMSFVLGIKGQALDRIVLADSDRNQSFPYNKAGKILDITVKLSSRDSDNIDTGVQYHDDVYYYYDDATITVSESIMI